MEEKSKLKLKGYKKKEKIISELINITKRTKTQKFQAKQFHNKEKLINKRKIIKNQIKPINEKEKTKKARNPGIDLVRLIAMYGIVINHILYLNGGERKYYKYRKYLKILHITTSWHNNAFALISGIIGYKSNKISNLIYLWLDVFFYSVGIYLYFTKIRKSPVKHDISVEYFPIIYERYWYFTAYFGMYLLLPVMNKGIEYLTKYEFTLVIISTIGLFAVWRDYKNPKNDVFLLNVGMSLLWMLTFYLTGAYIGKYRVDYSGIKKYIFYFICIFIYIFSNYLFFKLYNNELYLGKGHYQKALISLLKQMITERYDSILKIIQSITVCLFFMQINYNKYIAKIITFFGPLAFGIYLIHNNSIVKNKIMNHIFDKEPNNISLNSAMILVSLKSLKTLVICLIIDYFSNLLFTLLRIRKICVFIESKINKIFL